MRRGRKEEVNNNLALTFFLSAGPCVLALTVKSLDVGQSRRLTISHGLIGKEEDLGGRSDKKMVRKFIITFDIINETKKKNINNNKSLVKNDGYTFTDWPCHAPHLVISLLFPPSRNMVTMPLSEFPDSQIFSFQCTWQY